ncbi:MAG: hypothetical protein AAB417_00580 [Patescibacteria group bacterium]
MTNFEGGPKEESEKVDLVEVMERLKDPAEIKAFYDEYVESVRAQDPGGDAEGLVKQNIGFVLDRLADQEVAQRWRDALPGTEYAGYMEVKRSEIPKNSEIKGKKK